MAAKRKASAKEDLESKITELEEKLSKLAEQLEAPAPKPAEVKPAEVKPAEVKPAEVKPAEVKPAEVKPAEVKPAEVKPAPKPAEVKPAEAPKPTETTTELPVTFQAALEDAYYNSPMTDTHKYKAMTPGYSPAPNRYFVRLTAPVGKVPTSNWNDQKAKVSGYTQPSNQYFATRARLAYHPADKTFGSFSGANMSVEGVEIKAQQAPPPKPAETTTQQAPPPQQSSSSSNSGKSKQQILEEYEAEYLNRVTTKIQTEHPTESPPSDSQSKKGTLPKGF